jgi:hypothetical protein
MDNINEKIKNSHYHKFTGVAPEGFVLIPIEVLEKLKNSDIWNRWKEDDEFLIQMVKNYCNNI